MKYGIYIMIAVGLGLFRIHGDKSHLFQALAHLFTGGMFAASFVYFGLMKHINLYIDKIDAEIITILNKRFKENVIFYLALGVSLTILETICFFLSRK